MSKCTGLIMVLLLLCALFPTKAFTQVIVTNDWESKPGGAWSYAAGQSGIGAEIDCAMPSSPSGGCAIRMVYPAGTYSSSTSGGIATFGFGGEPKDLYLGAWMRYSNPFTFHQNGHKVNFFILSGGNTGCRNVAFGYGNNAIAAAPQICWGPSTKIYSQNVATWTPQDHLGEWHWYETRVKLNTPGGYDGVLQIWIDDILYVNYDKVPIRDIGDNAGFNYIQHTAIWGGGGGTIAQTGYWWIDHTVLSTSFIGMPGGSGLKPSFLEAGPISISARAGTSFGRKVPFTNPISGSSAELSYLNKPDWVNTVGDSFYATAPGVSGKYSFSTVLSVGGKAYDTLAIQVVVSGTAVVAVQSSSLSGTFGVWPTGSQGTLQFKVITERPGNFHLTVFNVSGAKVWEYTGATGSQDREKIVRWSSAETSIAKTNISVLCVVLEQNGKRTLQRFVAQ